MEEGTKETIVEAMVEGIVEGIVNLMRREEEDGGTCFPPFKRSCSMFLQIHNKLKVFNGMAKFYKCFIKEFYIYNGPNYQTHEEDITISMDLKMSSSLGVDKIEVYRSTCSDIS